MNKILLSLGLAGTLLTSPLNVNKANAHWVESNPNHAHVCTESTSLNVRSGYSQKSSIIGSLAKGATVQIKGNYYNWETQESWFEVYLNNGKTGWVNGNYICF